jgi:hypothetical protein
MFFIPFILWFGTAFYFSKKKIYFVDGTDYVVSLTVCTIFTGILLFATILVNMIVFSTQKSDYLELVKLQESKVILQAKADTMSKMFSDVLVKNYPQYEKDIFDKMTPEDFKILFVKYPEIKASLTNISYVDRIESLYNDIYNMELEMRKIVKDIRYTFVNPWTINFLTPTPKLSYGINI